MFYGKNTRFTELTRKETQILWLVVHGVKNKVSAEKLRCSPRTIEFHKSNLLQKVGARNTAELILRLYQMSHAQKG